eukprot:NODE_749_length_4226_cov_0.916404.p2 type:complete len:202 gc:universal NODE_749_length_4226_cov_0.916404:3921-3316(-)
MMILMTLAFSRPNCGWGLDQKCTGANEYCNSDDTCSTDPNGKKGCQYFYSSPGSCEPRDIFLSADTVCGWVRGDEGLGIFCPHSTPYCVKADGEGLTGYLGFCKSDIDSKSKCDPLFSAHPECKREYCGDYKLGGITRKSVCSHVAPYCEMKPGTTSGSCYRYRHDSVTTKCNPLYSWNGCKKGIYKEFKKRGSNADYIHV